jgi:hypothetical protein
VVYREDENQAGEVIPEEYDMIELGTLNICIYQFDLSFPEIRIELEEVSGSIEFCFVV